MGPRHYLPSIQFILMAGSLALSAGLIYGATYYTRSSEPSSRLTAAQNTALIQDQNWERTLAEIQAQDPSYSLPEPPSAESVAELLEAAQSTNITDTVGRTLLINLSAAKSQGLGDDIPTQNQIIDLATEQLQPSSAKIYTTADLQTVTATTDTLRTYGNQVMTVLTAHPRANYNETLRMLVVLAEEGGTANLQTLRSIGAEYKVLTTALLVIPVPQTLAPLHIQLINGFSRVASTYPDMESVLEDPLRSLVGIQNYQAYSDEVLRVFTTVAQQLSKDAILFSKDEPGNAWSVFLSLPSSGT